MLRVVADTNIYVSAFNFRGVPGKILELAQGGQLLLFVSAPILHELEGVLRRKFVWPEERASCAITNLLRFTHLLIPERRVAVVTEDPADNRILECALQARADVIVSGDSHLLKMKTFQTTSILTARQFLRAKLSISNLKEP